MIKRNRALADEKVTGDIGPTPDLSAPVNPYLDAQIVWHMATPTASENYPVDLAVCGKARLGEKLASDEKTESTKRGGDGCVAILEGGWLSLDTYRARRLRPAGNAICLYVRAWVGPSGSGALFFSDFMALTIHPTGLAIGFLGVKTPAGKVYRELPLGVVVRGQWLDLIIRIANGCLDFCCNGEMISSFPLRQELCAPFDDDLLIGAFKCSKPDLYGTSTPRAFPDCRIDTVALWHQALPDDLVALLSGVEHLSNPGVTSALSQAFLDYNAFFDASVEKDIEACATLWRSLRTVADQDPSRPVYHLTQPLGFIFDPCGAYYHGGKYHVFSYRNIFSLLEYASLDHYVSEDLVHWCQWPIGPWADSHLDVFCIYLMNHFIDNQGIPRALYTGQGTEGKFGVLARSVDGLLSYTDKQPVLTRYHHDGHVWKEGDTWYTITSRMCKGTRPGTLGDAVMLWTSTDLNQWQEQGEIFTQPKDEFAPSGFMEFPYLLSFGDKDVMILGGHPVRYWVGRFDRRELTFVSDKPEGMLLDYANPFHCFNPLCVDQQGSGGAPRRIIMALYTELGGGGTNRLPWSCVHAIPRILELAGDHLHQEPVPELQALRGGHHIQQDIIVTPDHARYLSHRGDTVEIMAEFAPQNARCFGLKVYVSDDGASFVRIYFDTVTNEYGVDASIADGPGDAVEMPQGRGPSYLPQGQPVRMHVFLDKGMLEAFVNGQTCTTSAPERLRHGKGIDLFCEGGTVHCTRLAIWTLKPPGAGSR